MAAGFSDLVDLDDRLKRVQAVRSTPDFEPIAASFKRIKNILTQAGFTDGGKARPDLLEPGPERELYDEYERGEGQPLESRIASLRPKVDLFFDKVLVNAPDPAVRQNRLTLLNNLLTDFSTIADFSEIVTPPFPPRRRHAPTMSDVLQSGHFDFSGPCRRAIASMIRPAIKKRAPAIRNGGMDWIAKKIAR